MSANTSGAGASAPRLPAADSSPAGPPSRRRQPPRAAPHPARHLHHPVRRLDPRSAKSPRTRRRRPRPRGTRERPPTAADETGTGGGRAAPVRLPVGMQARDDRHGGVRCRRPSPRRSERRPSAKRRTRRWLPPGSRPTSPSHLRVHSVSLRPVCLAPPPGTTGVEEARIVGRGRGPPEAGASVRVEAHTRSKGCESDVSGSKNSRRT